MLHVQVADNHLTSIATELTLHRHPIPFLCWIPRLKFDAVRYLGIWNYDACPPELGERKKPAGNIRICKIESFVNNRILRNIFWASTHRQKHQYDNVIIMNELNPTCVASRGFDVVMKAPNPITTPLPMPYRKLFRKHGIFDTSRPKMYSDCSNTEKRNRRFWDFSSNLNSMEYSLLADESRRCHQYLPSLFWILNWFSMQNNFFFFYAENDIGCPLIIVRVTT